MKLGQLRSCPVSLGKGMPEAVLFVYSAQGNIDPWHEEFNYPTDTLKMSLYTMDGVPMWTRDLGNGVIPGVWYAPFISFDLDRDGVDEIFFLNNLNPNLPFSLNARVLERIDPLSGETTGQWKWPQNTVDDTMSHSYRFYITGGYVHGEPVLVTAQGTYRDMYLQGYNTGMSKRWDIKIPYGDGGARASHLCPILDFDEDGVDEMFWGERLISLDDGHELFCCDKGLYFGHSDLVFPFYDENGKKYIFTAREDDERPGVPRVVTYDEKGNRVWKAINDIGHMHTGWMANIGPNRRKIAMAMRINRQVVNNAIVDLEPTDFFFDAVTGEELQNPLPFVGHTVMPVDFNGDGTHEFFGTGGNIKGFVTDAEGNRYGFIGGEQVRSGKVIADHPGETIMVYYAEEGKVRIWGDEDAVENEYAKKRFSHPYHVRMQHFMGTGYNHLSAHVSCGW